MTTKLNYSAHRLASAPENSKPALEQLERAFGVIPNIAGAIANSPKLINSLLECFNRFTAAASPSRRYKSFS